MPDHIELASAEHQSRTADRADERARRRRAHAHRVQRSRENSSRIARLLRRLGLIY
jgi:hypothetical protein